MIMKSSELRIGNLVYDSPNGDDISINATDILGMVQFEVAGMEPTYLEPIPLTPEWLLKNTVVACAGKDTEWYELSANGWLKVKPLEGSFFFFVGKEEVCEVTTVHSLQNIFFAITGRELKIVTP